jgi:small-conductance mechanosensitive channel
MKKTIITFVISALLLFSLVLWAINADISGNIQEYLMIAVVIVMVGFALYIGLERLKGLRRKEPVEDELSKKIMTKASSLSFYVSIYLWLFIMYMSDKTTMETHSLIGAGILGMSIIFLLSWLGVKLTGMKNG